MNQTDPETTVDRIPLAHSVRYVARGLPEVPNKYGDGVLAPSEITLTYRAAPDSQLGRVHAYVAGRLWVNGAELPLLSGGLYGQHYDDGLGGWPDWLAEEARLHDPDAVVSPPTDQATLSGRLARRVAEDASAVRMDLYEDLATYARQTGNAGLQHSQIRDHLAEFLFEGLLRRLAVEAHGTGTQQQVPQRAYPDCERCGDTGVDPEQDGEPCPECRQTDVPAPVAQQPAVESPCCSDPTCACVQVNAEGRCECARWGEQPAPEQQAAAADGEETQQ